MARLILGSHPGLCCGASVKADPCTSGAILVPAQPSFPAQRLKPPPEGILGPQE